MMCEFQSNFMIMELFINRKLDRPQYNAIVIKS